MLFGLIYLFTAVGLKPMAVVQYTFTHKQCTEKNMIENTQNETYITIRIHQIYNKIIYHNH